MERGPVVLLVGENVERKRVWAAWLADAGLDTIQCEGPHLNDCPRLRGEPCSLRETADVALVELRASDPHGGWPERSCTTMPDDGRTLFACEQFIDRARLPLPSTRGSLVFAVERARATSRGGPAMWTHRPRATERTMV